MDRLTEEPMSEEDLKIMLDGMGADRKELEDIFTKIDKEE